MQLLAVIPFFLIFVGIGLSNTGMLPAMVGWGLCAFGILFGLGAAITIFFVSIRKRHTHFWMYAIIAVVPFAITVPMVITDLSYPRINDITTNTENPPSFVAALQAPDNIGRDMAYPDHFRPVVREAYPDIQPLTLNKSPEQAFQRIEKLVKVQPGWVITHRDNKKRILEGEVTTSFFRFIDDFVIQVSDQDGKSRVDMRSKSRDGLVDAGVNAKRIRAFLSQLAN